MSDVGTLCLACGLCCDGTLFGLMRLDASEAALAARHRLRVVTHDDGASLLRQPCSALEGTVCRVYAERPVTCRRYLCNLATALYGNELDLDEALALVRDTRSLRDALASALGPDAEPGTKRRLQERAKEAHRPLLGEPLPAAALEALSALEEQLDRHFRGRRR